MSRIKIAINWSLEQYQVEHIQQVSPKVDLCELASTYRPSTESSKATSPNQYADQLSDCEVIFAQTITPQTIEMAPRLRWVHLATSGVDGIITRTLLDKPIVFTNNAGITSKAVAEHAITLMLMLAKQMPLVIHHQRQSEWAANIQAYELRQKTLGLIGLGGIGKEIARLAKAFGMNILALRRSPILEQGMENIIDQVLQPPDLPLLLQHSDYVVLALPLTEQTRGMLGKTEFMVMKRSAFLINISRGGLVDEQALSNALSDGIISGAGVDVFMEEPLVPNSELWHLPNIIITPHMAGNTEQFVNMSIELFCMNLERYLQGKDLLNPVSVLDL